MPRGLRYRANIALRGSLTRLSFIGSYFARLFVRACHLLFLLYSPVYAGTAYGMPTATCLPRSATYRAAPLRITPLRTDFPFSSVSRATHRLPILRSSAPHHHHCFSYAATTVTVACALDSASPRLLPPHNDFSPAGERLLPILFLFLVIFCLPMNYITPQFAIRLHRSLRIRYVHCLARALPATCTHYRWVRGGTVACRYAATCRCLSPCAARTLRYHTPSPARCLFTRPRAFLPPRSTHSHRTPPHSAHTALPRTLLPHATFCRTLLLRWDSAYTCLPARDTACSRLLLAVSYRCFWCIRCAYVFSPAYTAPPAVHWKWTAPAIAPSGATTRCRWTTAVHISHILPDSRAPLPAISARWIRDFPATLLFPAYAAPLPLFHACTVAHTRTPARGAAHYAASCCLMHTIRAIHLPLCTTPARSLPACSCTAWAARSHYCRAFTAAALT